MILRYINSIFTFTFTHRGGEMFAVYMSKSVRGNVRQPVSIPNLYIYFCIVGLYLASS